MTARVRRTDAYPQVARARPGRLRAANDNHPPPGHPRRTQDALGRFALYLLGLGGLSVLAYGLIGAVAGWLAR